MLQVVVLKGESQPWVLDRQQPGVLAKCTKSWQDAGVTGVMVIKHKQKRLSESLKRRNHGAKGPE